MQTLYKLEFLLLVNLIIGIANVNSLDDPLVQTDLGLIRGVRPDDGGDYAMFLGIPYASVDPSHPFASSTPYPQFEEIFEANDDSIVCPQKQRQTDLFVGVVDCLRLNVFVPNSASLNNELPVLIYIHGGRFEVGSAARREFNPRHLLKHNVIVVTINYRLGPYGFMCLDIPEVSNNAAFKDQRLALRWVKQHIQMFGGNPNAITVGGQSAGSMSIDYHLHYLAHENLFHKVIMQSGTTQVYAATNEENGSSYPITVAEELGFVTDDPKEAISFLSATDPLLVIAITTRVPSEHPKLKPCDETHFTNSDKFIDEIISKKFPAVQNIPILIGFTTQESLLQSNSISNDDYNVPNIVKEKLDIFFNFDDDEMEHMSKMVSRFYWGDETVKENMRQEILDFHSDISFAYPITKDILHYFNNGAIAIYQYLFSFIGTRNLTRVRNNITEGSGAAHSDDVGYLFDRFELADPTPEDQVTIDRMTTLYTNFVKYGDPTPQTSELLPIKWEPLTKERFNFLNIDSELSLGQRPYHDRFAFWDVLFELNKDKKKLAPTNGINRDMPLSLFYISVICLVGSLIL